MPDSRDDADQQACEVPLVEQLRGIPKDYRTVRAIQWSDDGRETGHQFIPVGHMMHRAADEIERLRATPPTTESEKVADLKRQLAGERDHGKRLQQQLDAILRTNGSPQPSNERAVAEKCAEIAEHHERNGRKAIASSIRAYAATLKDTRSLPLGLSITRAVIT